MLQSGDDGWAQSSRGVERDIMRTRHCQEDFSGCTRLQVYDYKRAGYYYI